MNCNAVEIDMSFKNVVHNLSSTYTHGGHGLFSNVETLKWFKLHLALTSTGSIHTEPTVFGYCIAK